MSNLLEKVQRVQISEETVTTFPEQPTSEQVKIAITVEVTAIIEWISGLSQIKFFEFEKGLIGKVFALGRLFIALFFCLQEEHWQSSNIDLNSGEKRQGVKDRLFGTIFGKVRYWRSYIYRGKALGGYFPLDIELGLPWDAFSMLLRSYAARIATKMSYAQTVSVLALFLGWSPCQKTVEEMVLGMGRHTSEWFETCPPPENDGDVLIMEVDSKATPTATEEELKKRRGKRSGKAHSGSPRHRRKAGRKEKGSKKRKKKGDKSKNGRMVTIVVMYTLKRNSDGTLEGPINKKVYASYSSKQHAIAVARREADKRGFCQGSGKTVQVITDGDNDLERHISKIFPEAIHTIDIFHVTEYLWEAGRSLFKEGSAELIEWVEALKEALYEGRIEDILDEIQDQLDRLPKRGPGTKNKRSKLEKARGYIFKRIGKMDYKTLQEQDLEISSGAVEGAVNYVIAKRFDCGGMRWIRQRAEALLHLRCIEINGDWEAFIEYIHDKTTRQAQQYQENLFVKSKKANELSTYGLN